MCPIANIVNRYVTLHFEKLRTLKIFHSGLILRPVQRALKKQTFLKCVGIVLISTHLKMFKVWSK